PVAGALLEVGEPFRRDPVVLGRSGADGTFALRACPSPSLIGARAEGYASSSLQMPVSSSDGTPRHVRLELIAPGGMVEGLVVASDGKPVANAVVRIGEGRTDELMATGTCPPLPAQVRTDAQGAFRAIGVPVGNQTVQVRAVDFAPFSGSCEIYA